MTLHLLFYILRLSLYSSINNDAMNDRCDYILHNFVIGKCEREARGKTKNFSGINGI